ncbi:tRNA guanosine(15) transglycosylase TgtA [Halocatena halophila]|uniref:tRNA guanosine(15) transglycosylase TgtA n=1 Tax=Halocatena halophila TaxID=2814576 RepID=UPI002ED0C995
MSGQFEIRTFDAAGRVGELSIPRAGVTIETPALLPVVNPHIQTLSSSTLESLGAEILITNSYILHQSDDLRDTVLEEGLHSLLGFDGAIMTDSGSFQLAEYGEIEVTTEEILQFQSAIGSDISTPVDIPTPPGVSHEHAKRELQTTQERIELASRLQSELDDDILVSAPVQGSTHPDLRERAGRHAATSGLDVFPIGAVVPLLNQYRYATVADVVMAAKRGLSADAPVHLFGAGHPMMLAFAVAMGCDLFDSAAYAIYARDDRYLTVRGTDHLDELEYFPCSCSVCTDHTPTELQAMDDATRERLLARHNLSVTFAEIRRIKQAIRRGNLLELVETRARSHPTMLDGYRTLLDHSTQLERTDPVSKDAFFYLSSESARRPEVKRHHERLQRLSIEGSVLLTEGNSNDAYDACWRIRPPFGPFPRALSDTYPFTAELPERLDLAAYAAAADGIEALLENNPSADVTVALHNWPDAVVERLSESVTITPLHENAAQPPVDKTT